MTATILFRHTLPFGYDGTNPVFFNGSLFYHRAGTPKIVKYELATKKYEEVVIHPKAAHKNDKVYRIDALILPLIDIGLAGVDEEHRWLRLTLIRLVTFQ